MYKFNCLKPYKNNEYKEMERSLKELRKQYRKDIKLLLLGTGESGKSTFIRQMQIIYGNGFSEDERRQYINCIRDNILTSMQNMIEAMKLLKIDYEKCYNATKNVVIVMNPNLISSDCLRDPCLTAIKELWSDKGIQICYMRRNEYQLNDSTKYFLNEIDRIASPTYMPTDQDILRSRITTAGIIQYNFQVKKVRFRIIDVAGQRTERKKWLNCFDDIKAVIFLVAISEYDQTLKEHEQRNRLKESLSVLNTIKVTLNDIPIILFLNKTDLFEEKINYSHLDTFFPEFKGPRYDSNSARQFILDMFLRVRPKMYFRHTCATDTDNIKMVFTAVKDIILKYNLGTFGLV